MKHPLVLAFDAALTAKLKHDACRGTLTAEEDDILRISVTRLVGEVYDQVTLARSAPQHVRVIPFVKVWFSDEPLKGHMLGIGLTTPMLEPLKPTNFFHATGRVEPPPVDGRYVDETASLLLDKVILDIMKHRRELEQLKGEFSTWLERNGGAATLDDLGWSFPTLAGYLPGEAKGTIH